MRDTRAVFTSRSYEGLSLGSVARESLESHAGGAWPERGQLTHVHVVRASYYTLHVTDVPFHRQRRNRRKGRSHSLVIRLLRNEYRIFFIVHIFANPAVNEPASVATPRFCTESIGIFSYYFAPFHSGKFRGGIAQFHPTVLFLRIRCIWDGNTAETSRPEGKGARRIDRTAESGSRH